MGSQIGDGEAAAIGQGRRAARTKEERIRGDLDGEGNYGGGTDHALGRDDRVEDALQVAVAPGDHPAQHVARAGDRVRLGDRGEPVGDGIVAAGLADLQRDERGHRIAERGRVHLGPYPVITPRCFILARRASTVPRATPSRREASSSTPAAPG
jgi:hypothetical protein